MRVAAIGARRMNQSLLPGGRTAFVGPGMPCGQALLSPPNPARTRQSVRILTGISAWTVFVPALSDALSGINQPHGALRFPHPAIVRRGRIVGGGVARP